MRKKTLLTSVLVLNISLILSLFMPLISRADSSVIPSAIDNGKVKTSGNKFVDGSGHPFFLMGVNYVGNTDRAWLMWDNDKFDANLIAQNFQQASDAGLNTVRIFVMKSLRDDINAGNFGKLDQVFDLAATKGLHILLSFNDYSEPDLNKEAQLDKKIANRYSSKTVLLGYDLKNEPQFEDVTGAIYPTSANVPLQKEDFIKVYGERIKLADFDNWRQTTEGKQIVPARMDSHTGYVYANAYKLFIEFLNESSKWVASNSGKNTLDYIDSPDSSKWKVFLDALSGTIGAWIDTRTAPIREVDTQTPITIGWSNFILAKMQANSKLGFVSLHRFPPEGYSNLITTMNLLNNLQATFNTRPVILEEFGYSNAKSDNTPVATNLTANYETVLWLFLSAKGFAGGLKWMLVNFPPGFNKVENNFGLLDDNSQPKLAYYALKAVTAYVRAEGQHPDLTLNNLQADSTNVLYQFKGGRSLFSNATTLQNGPLRFTQTSSSPFSIWWPGDGLGEIDIQATQSTSVAIDLNSIYPQRTPNGIVKLISNGTVEQSLGTSGSNGTVTFNVKAGAAYTLRVPIQPPAFKVAQPIGGNTRYFPQTGHNLGGAFRSYWEQHGGLAIFGYPLSEEFTEGDYVVQYFERNRFEYHPEFKGTPNEVLLGLLGRSTTSGREQEIPFQRIGAFVSGKDRLFFNETGHSLNYGFKYYWEQHGGLAQFGFPISEEFSELNPADGKIYTVQYFERARFEYHPEYKGTPYETLLGLLGWQLAKAKGWIAG